MLLAFVNSYGIRMASLDWCNLVWRKHLLISHDLIQLKCDFLFDLLVVCIWML